MTLSLLAYRIATGLLEPLAPVVLDRRVRAGKERVERRGERLGRASCARPDGPVIWMHGASVGESALLLQFLDEVRGKLPDVAAVVTTQTLTSAELIGRKMDGRLIHQMAPVDAPAAVRRFLDHWRPDAAVFAEGEIWPNLLGAVRRRAIPAALVNARMTARSLEGWGKRAGAARDLFGAFGFLGAADLRTAEGLGALLGRRIDVVGNLKRSVRAVEAAPELVDHWRAALMERAVVLAASTHKGEEAFALDAFEALQAGPAPEGREPLLIVVPRHPERGDEVRRLCEDRDLRTLLRSSSTAMPDVGVDVLVADTLGELMLWFAISDGVYLGGATIEGVGGHNPMEPAQVRKRAFSGPHGFNFADTFEALEGAGALMIGALCDELTQFWRDGIGRADARVDWAGVDAYLASARASMDASVDAVVGLMNGANGDA